MFKNYKNYKNTVMIVGHKNPHFLIDTAESVRFYNKNCNIVFAIDHDEYTAKFLTKHCGYNRVFLSSQKNGWGRGILRTIIHALDYFKERMPCENVITMDSDALCTGPFVNIMASKVTSPEIFFVGTIWNSPGKDHGYHHKLRASGFMSEYPYIFNAEMAAGPCMLWSTHCFKFLETIGLMPGSSFDKKYHMIHFAHDQISTYLKNCGVCRIGETNHIMEMRWRSSLPTVPSIWGPVPHIHNHTSIIHPTESHLYTEENCRGYFRNKRFANFKIL